LFYVTCLDSSEPKKEISFMENMKLRQVAAGDERLLFDWKNDPITRANSRDQTPVAWSDHLVWFAAAVSDPQKVMCIAEVEGVPVGLVRSGPNQNGQIEVCFTVDPKWRNQGAEEVMVELFVAEHVPYIDNVVLPIKIGNTSGERTVSILGYHRLMPEEGEPVVNWAMPTTSDA